MAYPIFQAGDIVLCIEGGSGVIEGHTYTIRHGSGECGFPDMVRVVGREDSGRNYSKRFVLAAPLEIIGDNDDDCI